MANYQFSPAEKQELFKQLCVELRSQLSPGVFNAFLINSQLEKVEFLGEGEAICVFLSPSPFHASSVKKLLEPLFKQTLHQLLAKKIIIKYQIGTPIRKKDQPQAIGQDLKAYQPVRNADLRSPRKSKLKKIKQQVFNQPAEIKSPRVEDLFSQSNIASNTLDRAKISIKNAGLREDYTFDKFAVSSTNEMAHAAATAVSSRPGTAYNPLFLYGGVGVGKTHLMHAIGINIIKNDPQSKILYCTGEEFTNEIVKAIQSKKALKFKSKYRNAQVLMIDDVQFIAGKDAVQEEFFHTFNALTKLNRQIVLTSDRPPHEINLLEDRLKSRFEAGLMIDIGQPSFELRTAILLIKAQALQIDIPMNLAQLVASKVDSARKIEGVVKQVKSAVELQKQELNEDLMIKILKNKNKLDKPQKLRVKPQDVIKAVANHYHVQQTAIKGKSRLKHLVKARHVSMYLFYIELQMPLKEIGRWFSNRDHTSVLHGRDKIIKEINLDEELKRDVNALKMNLAAISK